MLAVIITKQAPTSSDSSSDYSWNLTLLPFLLLIEFKGGSGCRFDSKPGPGWKDEVEKHL